MKRRAARVPSTIRKHSLLVAGHATSISLEEAFWSGLKAIAAERQMTTAQIVAEVDGRRDSANLSSAIRVFVLDFYQGGPKTAPGGPQIILEPNPSSCARCEG